ncbi:MAG: ABC transporter ATP-binding protein [Anaerolineaceae bacterium]|nr:ABC transporter ATP-binding protein [Anaerolineaceae bacterium]
MEVSVKDLAHTFNHTAPAVHVLEDLNLCVKSGEFVAIIGANGCGKSTLLRLIANLLQPKQGSITLDGLPPAQMTASRRVVWMSQNPALLPWYTARQNIQLAQRFARPSPDVQSPVEELLHLVDLENFADAHPHTFSGGMQQRLSLARALAMDADLWLMDEPFAALDELTRERLTIQLDEIWQRRRPTVLWVTHSIPEAVRLSDRVLVITPRPGRLFGEVAISLPRPREDTTPEFQMHVRALKDMLFVSEGLP